MNWLFIATAGLPLVALSVGLWVYRLAVERDRHDREPCKPQVTLIVPRCDGVGPWTITYQINNRHNELLVVENIRMPLEYGKPPKTQRNRLRFAEVGSIERRIRVRINGESGVYEVLKLNMEVAAGQQVNGSFEITSEPRVPLEQELSIRVYFDVFVRNKVETAYNLRIDRIVKPT